MIILALVLASVSVILSVTLPLLLRDATLRKAFNQLEDDFETQSESVRSALGRVGRLKRAIMRGEIPQEEGAEPETGVQSSTVNGSAPSLSQRQLDWQKKILSRRHPQ